MQGSHESGASGERPVRTPTAVSKFAGLDEGTADIFLMDNPNDGAWTYRAAADTALKTGRTTEAEIEPIRVVEVEGGVADADSGSPIAGVPVGLHGPIRPRSDGGALGATTDEDGRYHFRLPPGKTCSYLCGQAPAEYGRMRTGTIGRLPGR